MSTSSMDNNADNEPDNNADINNYSIEDLKQLLSLDSLSYSGIVDTTKYLIEKLNSNPDLVNFFKKAQEKLLKKLQEHTKGNELETKDIDAQDVWRYRQYPPRKRNEPLRSGNAMKVMEQDTHFVMSKDNLSQQNVTINDVVQGTLNPNLKNINTLLVCIDSQYRQNIFPYPADNISLPSFNTDYTLDLSDPLKNVLSITLTSIEIPTTWYTFSKALGNTCFNISTTSSVLDCSENECCVCIDDGNYTYTQLEEEIEKVILTALIPDGNYAFCTGPSGECVDVSINPNTRILCIENHFGYDITLTFYTPRGFTCNKECGAHTYVNSSLGWYLGFRLEPDEDGVVSITIKNGEKVCGQAPVNIAGSRYFILSIDDYNQNHLNKGLVNIIQRQNKLDLPTYYHPDELRPQENPANLPNVPKCVAVKKAPRKLTQAQLYSINQIMANRITRRTRAPGPTTSDVLAIIPLKNIQRLRDRGEPYVEFGGSLQTNKRIYFGPVDVDRLRVKLLDDKGNLVNLHGNDWSFTMIIEQLYQY